MHCGGVGNAQHQWLLQGVHLSIGCDYYSKNKSYGIVEELFAIVWRRKDVHAGRRRVSLSVGQSAGHNVSAEFFQRLVNSPKLRKIKFPFYIDKITLEHEDSAGW